MILSTEEELLELIENVGIERTIEILEKEITQLRKVLNKLGSMTADAITGLQRMNTLLELAIEYQNQNQNGE